jgi:hypothetical protein
MQLVAKHDCDEACGIFFDPLCPCWFRDGPPAMKRLQRLLPWAPGDVASLVATMASPSYRSLLRAAIADLLAPTIRQLIREELKETK